MKKNVKILTMILAVVLMLQTAPLSALGDATSLSDTYETGEEQNAAEDATDEAVAADGEETSVDAEEPAESTTTDESETEILDVPQETEEEADGEPETGTEVETAEPEETEIETEPEAEPAPAITVRAMQWQNYKTESQFFMLKADSAVRYNNIRFRLILTDTPTAVEATVDGVALPCTINGQLVLIPAELLNGSHTLNVKVINGTTETTETLTFTVNGSSDYPELGMTTATDFNLGETQEFVVTGKNVDELASVTLNISLTRQLKVEDVVIADGVVGMYTWYRGALKLTLEVCDASAIRDDVLVTVKVKAPTTLEVGQELTWSMDSAVVTMKENSTVGQTEYFVNAFTAADMSVSVGTKYTVTGAEQAITGAPYTLTVTDVYDIPVAGVAVYTVIDGAAVQIGVTDENGTLTTDYFNVKGTYEVYAEDENGAVSAPFGFTCYETVGSADGLPYSVLYNGVVSDGKNVTWMSHLVGSDDAAMLLLSTSADMAEAVIYNGTSVVTTYETSLSINRVNAVSVTGLVPGTTYYYQVGDGTVWSEPKAFTVKTAAETVRIAIVGDMANSGSANIALIADAMAQSGVDYDFAIRTGSMVSDPSDYAAWAEVLSSVSGSALGNMDMIHTATKAEMENGTESSVFGTDTDYVHYVYGNVFVAVVNYTDDYDALEDILTEMVWDAKESCAAWRILSLRQSPYSTDPANADSIVAELVPFMAEQAGIDLVISGGDCNYARTAPMRYGDVTEKNGVTYIVCGSAGEKGSVLDANESYHFVATSDSYHALYLSVTATEDTLTVLVYDVREDGSVEVIDTYIATPYVCSDDAHIYRYGVSSDSIVCDICDHRTTISGYTGPLAMLDFYMYMENGSFVNGWKTYGGNVYYISPRNYISVDGEQTIDGYTYVFKNNVLVEGCWIEEDGARKLVWAGEVLTNTWHTQGGVTYYFLENGACATGTVEIPSVDENGETVVETYLFDESGALIGKQ